MKKSRTQNIRLIFLFSAAEAALENAVLLFQRLPFLALTAQRGNCRSHGHYEHDADECCKDCQDREHGGVPFCGELRSSSSVLAENAYGASRSVGAIYLGSIDLLVVIESDCGSQHTCNHCHPKHVNHGNLTRHVHSLPAALPHLICVDQVNASVLKWFPPDVDGGLPTVF